MNGTSHPWPPGSIVLAGTPIGHTGDASPRLIEALTSWGLTFGASPADAISHRDHSIDEVDGQSARGLVSGSRSPEGDLVPLDVIAAEDTRRLRGLAGRLGITLQARIVSYHDHNEASRAEELVAIAERGGRVLVVSDAGMPAVSDPGYRIVAAAASRGLEVSVIPGPSAALAALAVSGLPSDRFSFEGFIPRKPAERTRIFRHLADDPRTLIFFESPHRISSSLATMVEVFGANRAAVVCRELTKTFQEVKRGTLSDLDQWSAAGLRGEITVVVAGATRTDTRPEDAVELVRELVADGMRLKNACRQVAGEKNVSSRELYELMLRP